jgi:hypothetical protein
MRQSGWIYAAMRGQISGTENGRVGGGSLTPAALRTGLEWETPQRSEDARLPDPITLLLRTWRERRDEDIQNTAIALQQADTKSTGSSLARICCRDYREPRATPAPKPQRYPYQPRYP